MIKVSCDGGESVVILGFKASDDWVESTIESDVGSGQIICGDIGFRRQSLVEALRP
jgi:hypothetical protein